MRKLYYDYGDFGEGKHPSVGYVVRDLQQYPPHFRVIGSCSLDYNNSSEGYFFERGDFMILPDPDQEGRVHVHVQARKPTWEAKAMEVSPNPPTVAEVIGILNRFGAEDEVVGSALMSYDHTEETHFLREGNFSTAWNEDQEGEIFLFVSGIKDKGE